MVIEWTLSSDDEMLRNQSWVSLRKAHFRNPPLSFSIEVTIGYSSYRLLSLFSLKSGPLRTDDRPIQLQVVPLNPTTRRAADKSITCKSGVCVSLIGRGGTSGEWRTRKEGSSPPDEWKNGIVMGTTWSNDKYGNRLNN